MGADVSEKLRDAFEQTIHYARGFQQILDVATQITNVSSAVLEIGERSPELAPELGAVVDCLQDALGAITRASQAFNAYMDDAVERMKGPDTETQEEPPR